MEKRKNQQCVKEGSVEIKLVGLSLPHFRDDHAVGLFVKSKHLADEPDMGECVSISVDGLLSISGVSGQTRISKREAQDLVHILEWFIDTGDAK